MHTLHAAGVLIPLKQALFHGHNATTSTAVLQAIRSLAVHNDIVQAIVANGILQRVVTLFQTTTEHLEDSTLVGDEHHPSVARERWMLLASCVGMFRNVCANDDIKYTLCAGSMSVVVPLVNCMRAGLDQQALQEHGCGTIAAMALRQPQNATFLLDAQVVPLIVQAMKRYPDRTSLQRQGCLAIRNLASRSDARQQQDMLELTRETLEGIAAKHLECQDEVFAALRDMGLHQAHTFVVQDADTGEVAVTTRQTFGQGHHTNFRAVYE